MGHAISYLKVDKKKDIMRAAKEFAFYNTDRGENPSGHYHGNLRVMESVVCDSYDEAVEYINSKITRSYQDMAVQFYDTDSLKDTAQITRLRERIVKNNTAREEYIKNNNVTKQKASFITCSNCKSKINKEYIRTNSCPVCRTSMLSATVQNRIQKFYNDSKELQKQITELQAKNKLKAPIKWCVKVEVHC